MQAQRHLYQYMSDGVVCGLAKGEDGKERVMTNAQKFQETFGIYATEMWAMPEHDFLKWLNADTPQTEETCERCVYVRGSQWCQGCNGTPKRWDGEKIVDTPQPDCKSCKQYGAVSVSCDRCDKSTHSNYEP